MCVCEQLGTGPLVVWVSRGISYLTACSVTMSISFLSFLTVCWNTFLKPEIFEHFSFLSTGWWRSYHGIPPDISIKEHQRCLGLHQWHVQASIAQLWLSWRPRGTCSFFSPLLLLILFTLTEHSKYHTQTCSTAEREQARAVTCPSAEFTLSLDEFLVHDVWKLVSCIWQEKFVLYQHASERI